MKRPPTPGWRYAVLLCLLLAGCGAEPEPAPLTLTQCEELKDLIAKKIRQQGVTHNFTLQILPSESDYNGRIVGTCGQGTKKIVYRRGK